MEETEIGLDKISSFEVSHLILLDVIRCTSGRFGERLMETKWLTVIETAQYLKMGRSTVYKSAQEGGLLTHKMTASAVPCEGTRSMIEVGEAGMDRG
ncbi:MAG: hypothetical protein WHX93_10980 [bacterium]